MKSLAHTGSVLALVALTLGGCTGTPDESGDSISPHGPGTGFALDPNLGQDILGSK